MSSNVGLTTPRGSGTSGYVQRNLSALKPRSTGYGQPYSVSSSDSSMHPPKVRKPDEDILRHDRLREIEVEVARLQEKLEEEEKLEEDEIEEECDRLRAKLLEELDRPGKRKDGRDGKRMKGYQVHELAEAKARESEKLRRALGLGKVKDGEESEHPMARQDRLNKERDEVRSRREADAEAPFADEDRDNDVKDRRDLPRSRRRRYSDD